MSCSLEAAIALWRAKPTLDWAEPLGLSRQRLSVIICKARRKWPDLPRGIYAKSQRRRKDQSAVIEHFRGTRNLEATGKVFGVTRERVRQIVAAHERATGETIERGYGRGNRYTERVEWRCADCGKTRLMLLSQMKSTRCSVCNGRRNSQITDALIEQWIVARRAGAKWLHLARDAGYQTHQSHRVPRTIWMHLIRKGRESEIGDLWPPGASRHWLRVYTPEGYEHLLDAA